MTPAARLRAAGDLIASLPLPCPDCDGCLTSLGTDPSERPLIQCGACGGIFDAIIFAAYRQEAPAVNESDKARIRAVRNTVTEAARIRAQVPAPGPSDLEAVAGILGQYGFTADDIEQGIAEGGSISALVFRDEDGDQS